MRTLVDQARRNQQVCPSCNYSVRRCSYSRCVWVRSITYPMSLRSECLSSDVIYIPRRTDQPYSRIQDYSRVDSGISLQRERATYPPFNQIPQGSLVAALAGAVREPLDFSNPTKNRVLFGCPGRFTGRFPAKERPTGNVILGSLPVT